MDTEGHVELTLELREHGWTDIAVKVGDAECVMDWISYCCDAFGDLLRAALMIAEGAPSAVCSFDREPAEWRLLLEARPLHGARSTELEICVFETEGWGRDPPAELGAMIFGAKCTPEAFCRAALRAAADVLNHYGEDGFQQERGRPFPRAPYNALATVMRQG